MRKKFIYVIASHECPGIHRTGGIGTYSRAAYHHLRKNGINAILITGLGLRLGVRHLIVPYNKLGRRIFGGIVHDIAFKILLSAIIFRLLRINNVIVEIPEYNNDVILIEILKWITSKMAWSSNKLITHVRCHASVGLVRKNQTIGGQIGIRRELSLLLERILVRCADVRSAPTEHYSALCKLFYGKDIRSYPNFIDCIGSPGSGIRFEKYNDKRTLFFYGTITEEKGYFDLVSAFSLVRMNIPNIRLVVAGFRNPRIKSEPAVEYIGFVDRETISELNQIAIATIIPSHYETFGMVLVEAINDGAVIIASDIKPFREVAGDNSGVEFFIARSTADLARAISSVCNRRDNSANRPRDGHKLVDAINHSAVEGLQNILTVLSQKL
jgi:glycosyltransferase involved in cell wall biosynthesis